MQRQLLLTAVFPHPVQIGRQQFGHIGMQVVVAVFPCWRAPVDQIDLEPLGPQKPHQTALGKQVIDEHVHRQGRYDHNGCPVRFSLNRDGLPVQLDKILGQWRVVTQTDQTVGVEGFKRSLPGLNQAGRPENPVKGVACIQGCLAGNARCAISG